MKFDVKYEILLSTAYHHYCNVSQTEPCKIRLRDGAGGKLATPEERLSDARYLENLGYLDMAFLDGNTLYLRISPKGYAHCNRADQQPSATFQIGSINGNAIIGNQNHATINVGSTLAEIRSYIERTPAIPALDKVQLCEFTNAVEKALAQNSSIYRGEFKQYANLLERYGAIVGAVLGQFVGYFLGR